MRAHVAVRPLVLVGGLIGELVAAPLAATAQVVDTRGHRFGSGIVFGGDESGYFYRALGQTFVAPPGFPLLQSFSFFLRRQVIIEAPPDSGAFGPRRDFDFEARVQAFDGVGPTGPVLFREARTRPATEPPDVIRAATFRTGLGGGLVLTPEQRYVAYLVALPSTPLGGRSVVGAYELDPYPFGANYRAWSTGAELANEVDLAFVARFTATPVPEPQPVALLAAGLVVAGAFATRRARPRRGRLYDTRT